MNKREITARQAQATIALFLTGSSLVSGGTTVAKQDSWFCIILAFVLILPMLWVYSEILNLSPGKNFYEIIIWSCGKFFGKVVGILYCIYALFLGSFAIRIFSEFVKVVNMLETPIIAITASMMLVVIYVIKKRVYVLGRLAKFIIPFILASVVFTVVLSIKNMDFSNIKPVFHNNLKPILSNTFLLFTLPMGETVLCVPLLAAVEHHEKNFPILLKGTFLGFAILLIANLRNLFVLGYLSTRFAFTSYQTVSIISIGEFFTRIEVLIAINLMLAGFFKLCVTLFSSTFFISKVLVLDDYAPLAVPCGLIIITLAILVHPNTEEMFEWLKYLPYFSLPFQVIIPIILLITGKIKKRISAGKESQKGVKKSPETL